MLYALHHDDNAEKPGEIHQANKVFVEDVAGYERLLGDLGHKSYVKANAAGLLPPDYWYVTGGELTERPVMRARAQAGRIKAGSDAVILDVPRGASVDIFAAGALIHSVAALDGDELQFIIPVRCRYRAIIRLWPFQDRSIDIEAV
jgi:hypothetical protein